MWKILNFTLLALFFIKVHGITESSGDDTESEENQTSTSLFNVSRHMSYDEVLSLTEKFAAVKNPENNMSLVEVETPGKSYMNRPIKLIKISTDPEKEKSIILMDALMHAREWSTLPALLYLVKQLTVNYTSNKQMLEDLDYYVIPVLNPDGYEYSRKVDRMWRKTRSGSGDCKGVDLNRNFDFHWGHVGASTNACDEWYRGEKPFSENESMVLRDIATKYKKRILGYISFHSYGGYLLHPYAYNNRKVPVNVHLLRQCGDLFAESIKAFSGTIYRVGTTASLWYKASGGSDDWMKGKARVPFSYTLELAGPDHEGFQLSIPSLIKSSEELVEGMKTLTKCMLKHRR